MTKQELENLIAEKVMGWEICRTEYTKEEAWHSDHRFIGVNTKYECAVQDWQPLTDLNQCFEALIKWKSEDARRCYGISEPCEVGLACCVLNEFHADTSIHLKGCSTNKSLNAAICLALAEAVTGTKQTLEVE